MDKEILETKLEALIHCIHRIKAQNITSLKELEENLDKQEIIILNLQRAVQNCVDVGNHILLDYSTPTPSTMAETFKYLAENKLISDENAENLSHAVGFRNIAIHQYESINCGILYSIVTSRLDDFKVFATAIEKLI